MTANVDPSENLESQERVSSPLTSTAAKFPALPVFPLFLTGYCVPEPSKHSMKLLEENRCCITLSSIRGIEAE